MDIAFTKMDGLGNDFVILDSRVFPIPRDEYFIKSIADRRQGVGCDQVIILESTPAADIFLHMYNQDGSMTKTCGNAARCVAHLVMEERERDNCTIATSWSTLQATRKEDVVTINMGIPAFYWRQIPLACSVDTNAVDLSLGLEGIGKGFCVSFGNPHVVFLCQDAQEINVLSLGGRIERHPLFPERTNIEFISPLANNRVRMRVWERGSGVTKACASGACASFLASLHHNLITPHTKAEIVMDGGSLFLHRNAAGEVFASGGYSVNFKGMYTYENT